MTVAVRTEYLKVLHPMVVVHAIDVVEDEHERFTFPRRALPALVAFVGENTPIQQPPL